MRMTELERRLLEWGTEYGGSRYENVGWPGTSPIAVLIKYHGRAPDGLNPPPVIGTPADEVEAAVVCMRLERDGKARCAVLRCEYWMRSAALEHKIQYLRERYRVRMSERMYFTHLKLAKAYVAGWLHVPVLDIHAKVAR